MCVRHLFPPLGIPKLGLGVGGWQSPFTWGNSESQSQFSFFGGGGKRECVETTRKANLKVQKGGGGRGKQTAYVCVTEPAENGRNKPKAV